MLRILRYVFAAIGLLFAVYGLVTKNFEFQPYMMLFLGLMILVMGLEEFQKNRVIAIFCFLAAGFSLFVGIYTF